MIIIESLVGIEINADTAQCSIGLLDLLGPICLAMLFMLDRDVASCKILPFIILKYI